MKILRVTAGEIYFNLLDGKIWLIKSISIFGDAGYFLRLFDEQMVKVGEL